MKSLFAILLAAFPAVASAAPAWCGNANFTGGYNLTLLSAPDPKTVLVTLTMATCSPSAEAAARMPDLDEARQGWGKRLGMAEDDWADMVPFAQLKQAQRGMVKWEMSSKNLAELTPLDQYKAIKERFHAPGSGDMADSMYIADALEPTLTEAGRLAAIESCIDIGPAPAANAVSWAICAADIKSFDAAKLATELHGDTTHNGAAKMAVRLHYYDVAPKLKAHADDVAKLIKLDPVYEKMFTLAAQARSDWASGVGKNTELLALATALDSATFFQSRAQLDGCEAKTTEALRAAVAKLPAKAFAKMNDERNDPMKGFASTAGPVLGANAEVQLAAIPYIECQPTSGIAVFLSAAVSKFPGQRGPRSAALDKLMGTPLQLDNVNAKVVFPSIRTRPYFLSHGAIASFGGVVKSVTPKGESVTVEFEHTSFKQEDCVKEHKTNRIERVTVNFEVLYERVCDQTAVVEHNNTWPPVELDAKFAKQVKAGTRISLTHAPTQNGAPGRRAQIRKAGKPGQTLADLLAVWPNKKATGPTMVLGASLK